MNRHPWRKTLTESSFDPNKKGIPIRGTDKRLEWVPHIFPCDAVHGLPLIWDGEADDREQLKYHADFYSRVNRKNISMEKNF